MRSSGNIRKFVSNLPKYSSIEICTDLAILLVDHGHCLVEPMVIHFGRICFHLSWYVDLITAFVVEAGLIGGGVSFP
jgi:hypothetical protein